MRFQFCLPAMGDGCPGHCHIMSVFTPDWCDYPADVCNTKTSLYRSQVFDRNIVLLAVSGGVNISRFWFFCQDTFLKLSISPPAPLSPAIEIYEPVFTITHILNIVKNKNKRSETNSRKNKHFIADFCLPLLNNWRIPFIICNYDKQIFSILQTFYIF